MTELTEEQNKVLMSGHCPDCASSIFLHGPCGGEAENIRCNGCGKEFWFGPPFTSMRVDRNAPEFYREPFNLQHDLIRAGYIRRAPLWKRIFGGKQYESV